MEDDGFVLEPLELTPLRHREEKTQNINSENESTPLRKTPKKVRFIIPKTATRKRDMRRRGAQRKRTIAAPVHAPPVQWKGDLSWQERRQRKRLIVKTLSWCWMIFTITLAGSIGVLAIWFLQDAIREYYNPSGRLVNHTIEHPFFR